MKRDDQILIIFGTRIPDGTDHQTIVQVPTSPNVCFYTTCKKQNKRNMPWNGQKNVSKFHFSNSQILTNLETESHEFSN